MSKKRLLIVEAEVLPNGAPHLRCSVRPELVPLIPLDDLIQAQGILVGCMQLMFAGISIETIASLSSEPDTWEVTLP